MSRSRFDVEKLLRDAGLSKSDSRLAVETLAANGYLFLTPWMPGTALFMTVTNRVTNGARETSPHVISPAWARN